MTRLAISRCKKSIHVIFCLFERRVSFLVIFIDSLPPSIDSWFETCVPGISLSNTRVCLRGGFLF